MTSASAAEVPPPNPLARAPRKPYRSISEGLAGHRNSLGVLRLVLAGLVIISHAFPLGGWGEDPMLGWTKYQESIGGLAVVGFFAISGYLIAKSGAGVDILQFLWRRVLRIFPAFWLVLIVGAVIVGPIVWLLDGNRPGGYLVNWGAGGPVGYIVLNADLTMRQWGIHDIFIDTPWGQHTGSSALNGSLWTLAYEWSCYLIIAVLVVLGVLKRARWVVLLVTLFYFGVAVSTYVVPGLAASVIPQFGDRFRITLPLIFLIGACFAMYSRSIPLNDILGVFSGIVVVASLAFGGWIFVGFPAFAYLLLWAAARLPEWMQWIGAKNDYSYGVYVYGFLVQQFTSYLGWHHWGYIPWVLATVVVTGACAWLSWHLVEKRAMQLKDFGPGRGLRYWFGWARQRFSRNSEKIKAAPQD
ncbi:acyltransferase family protein [Salinibacterium hongtaonis]|uniref:acyltransferase family protein n=1 Tax=Homoserinimonas hongtaonis TaxID=2079791 RepID=UPI00131F15C5|nr:acyltransferase [Salinibacterium hongtaonis]